MRRRPRCLARLALGATCFALVVGAAPVPERTAPSRTLYDGWARTTGLVPVRDGVRLALTVYRPTRNGKPVATPLPVLFTFTPYLARRIEAGGEIVGALETSAHGARPFVDFTRYGYVVAIADVRGKGASFGVRAAYADEHEGEDGHDLIEYLAAQPWSNGAVGMFGCSYVGGTQWAAARTLPPHLRAIFVEAAQFDAYRNVRRGGITGQFNTRPQSTAEDLPTAPVDGDDGTLKTAALEQHDANGQMADIVAALPYRDDRLPASDIQYWPLASPYPKIDGIRRAHIAVYAWGNWMDELADQAMLGYQNSVGSGFAKLVMGPGGHCDIDTVASFRLHLDFFDHVLKHVDNGIDRTPPIAFKTIGLPEDQAWRSAERLPLAAGPATRFYLDTAGRLAERAPARPSSIRYRVRYDIDCLPPAFAHSKPSATDLAAVRAGGPPPPGLWPCVDPAAVKSWTTAPLAAARWLSGFSIVDLHLAASADTPLFGYLEDVAPGGDAVLFAHGRLLPSHRRPGTAPYRNFGLPWHSDVRADALPVERGEAMNMRFELSPTSRIIAAGHRLRFSIAGADTRQRNLAALRRDPAPVFTVATGGKAGSYLEIDLQPLDRLLAHPRATLPHRDTGA